MPADKPSVDEIFLAAVELPVAERASYLDGACGEDSSLRERVEQLLNARSQVSSFLEAPAPELGATLGQSVTDQPIWEKPGTRIGPFKLLQKLGEGGMGVVYMAEQSEPVERRVALKIIKPGMDTRQVVARFEAERQALAMMDHPDIAKVFDAGTTDSGRPYFVMEMVKGVPITEYCDEHRLEPRQRLELFQQVCHAVQHAHQKGIIHRDIKPTNVLVAEYDDRAVPKIIDFGVAKAVEQRLTRKTMFTEVGTVVGTIEYMSPEQAKLNQLDIDTRSDIYSLGVLLYELLTGETPFDRKRLRSAAFDEMLRILREEDPPRPSMKLSTSDSLPSIAANRHVEPKRLSLLVRGELDWIVMKAMEKDRSRRYETANVFANDIANYLNDEAVQACPPSTAYKLGKFARRNKLPLAISVVAALVLLAVTLASIMAAVRFEKLASDNAQLVTDKTALAENLQTALGESEANLAHAQEQEQKAKENLALATTEQARAEGNLDLALKALDAVYLDAIGTEKLLSQTTDGSLTADPRFGGAAKEGFSDLEKELLRRGLDFYEQFSRQNAFTERASARSAAASYRVGLLQLGLGDRDAASTAARAAVEGYTNLAEDFPANSGYLKGLAQSYYVLADCNHWRPNANTTYKRAKETITAAIDLDATDATMFVLRARIHDALNQYEQAISDFARAVELEPDHERNRAAFASYLRLVQNPKLRDYRRSLEHALKAVELAPDWTYPRVVLASLYEVNFNNPEKALEHVEAAVRLDSSNPLALRWRARIHERLGNRDQALADFGRSLELEPSPWALKDRAAIYAAQGEVDRALADYAAAEEIDPNNVYVYEERGGLLLKMKRFEDAIREFDKAAELAPKRSWRYKQRADAMFHLGRFKECVADLKTALELNPDDTSALNWIPPTKVAQCPDESFKQGLIKLADQAVARSSDPARARRDRVGLYLELGEYAQAKQDYQELVTPNNHRHYDHYMLSLLFLKAGEEAEYRESCRTMLNRFANTEIPLAANFAAWTCVLLPDAVEDDSVAVDLATKASEAQPKNNQFLNTLGAVLFRADRVEEALEKLIELKRRRDEASEPGNSSPAYTWYFLAMAYSAAGQTDEAEDLLEQANAVTEKELSDETNPPKWNRRLTLEILRREATAKILARPDANRPEINESGNSG